MTTTLRSVACATVGRISETTESGTCQIRGTTETGKGRVHPETAEGDIGRLTGAVLGFSMSAVVLPNRLGTPARRGATGDRRKGGPPMT